MPLIEPDKEWTCNICNYTCKNISRYSHLKSKGHLEQSGGISTVNKTYEIIKENHSSTNNNNLDYKKKI
jgi:hypothetical protein